MQCKSVHILIFFLVAFVSDAMPVVANTNNTSDEACSAFLARDLVYSESTVAESAESGPRFAVPDGPLDRMMTDVFSELDGKLVERVETGFIIEFIGLCRDNPDQDVSWAVFETQKSLGLNLTTRNWGIREIDTESLLNGSCEEFVEYVQQNGIGVKFYNDPVRATFDAYWKRFDLNENDFEKMNAVESDAQFACSLEPEERFIDALDSAAVEYQLQRMR